MTGIYDFCKSQQTYDDLGKIPFFFCYVTDDTLHSDQTDTFLWVPGITIHN